MSRPLADRIGDRLHWLFLLIAGGFGLAIVYATPPNGASDEIAHEVRVVRIASGNLFGADRDRVLPDIKAWHEPFADLAMLDTGRRFSKGELRATLRAPLACAGVMRVANEGLAAYGPLAYALPALVYRASCAAGASFGAYLHAARIASLGLPLALIAAGIALAGRARWVLFAVAVLPGAMLPLASISADALLFGLCLMLLGGLAAILSRRLSPGRGLALIAVVAVAIAGTKPGYTWVPLAALVTLPMYRAGGWPWRRLALLFVLLPVAAQAGTLLLAGGGFPVVPGVDPAAQARLLLADPVHFLRLLARVPTAWPIGTQWSVLDTLIGLPVWMDTRLPPALSIALAGGLALAAGMGAEPALTGRMRLFLAVLAAGSVVLIALPLYLFATPTGNAALFGLQGRYFIPTLALLLFAGQVTLPSRVRGVVALALLALPCVALQQALQLIRWRYAGS